MSLKVYNWNTNNINAFSSNNCNGTVGHFTQVVWAETKQVGCGFVYYKDADPNFAQYPYRKVVIILVLIT